MLSKVGELRAAGHDVRVLFLDASTAELVRRYDATRRLHPLADDAEGLVESIDLERAIARPAARRRRSRDRHDRPQRAPAQGAGGPRVRFVTRLAQLQVAVESFGFKHGLPLDADIVMDVRFLPNPHWEDDLRPLTGHDRKVRDYVLETRRRLGVSSTSSTTCSRRCSRSTRRRAAAT